jgi:hypothetical protein
MDNMDSCLPIVHFTSKLTSKVRYLYETYEVLNVVSIVLTSVGLVTDHGLNYRPCRVRRVKCPEREAYRSLPTSADIQKKPDPNIHPPPYVFVV